jgi:hypothetical protein
MLTILIYGGNHIATETEGILIIMLILNKIIGGRIKTIQSIGGSDPKSVLAIFADHPNMIATETFAVLRIMIISCKTLILSVKPIQSDFRPDPQIAGVIF